MGANKTINKITLFAVIFVGLLQLVSALPQEVTYTNEIIEAPKPYAMPSIGSEGVDYRGDLSLNVPLMTVEGRNGFGFPVIAYYRSGIKVKEPASLIGLGWNLEIGSVTRVPVNVYDFHPGTWDCQSYKDSADPLPDKFVVTTPTSSINFSNITSSSSGGAASDQIHLNPKFVSTPIENGEDLEGTPVSLGHHAFDYSKFSYYLPDGTRYVYELGLKSNGVDIFWNGDEEKFACPEEPRNVKWLLTAILSPDYEDGSSPQDLNPLNSPNPALDNKGNWIAIEYYPVKAYHYAHDFDWQAFNEDPANYVPPLFHKEITYPYRIVTPTHVAEFVLEDEFAGENIVNPETLSEWDNPFEAGDSLKGERTKRVKEIKLFNYSGNGSNPVGGVIEGVEFNYALKDASLAKCTISGTVYGAKTTLKNIYLKGNDGSSLPPYSFDYNESMPDNNPSYSCYNLAYDAQNGWGLLHEDMFGYYSTFENGLDLLYQEVPVNDAKAWSLTEIAYPSGAKKKFTYGDDTIWHDFGQGAKYYALGGTRIRKIDIHDAEGSDYVYSYSYSASGDIPNMGFISSTPVIWLKHQYHIYNPYENPNSVNYFYPIAEEESFVYYDQIDEVFEGRGGKIRRNYALYNKADRTNIIPDPVKYPGGLNQVCVSNYWCVRIPFKNVNGLDFLVYSFQHSENSGMRGNVFTEEYYNSQNKLLKKIKYSRNIYLTREEKYFGTSPDSYLLFNYYWDGLTNIRTTYYDESGNSVDIMNKFIYAQGTPSKASWQAINVLSEEEQFKYASSVISNIRRKEIVYAWDTGRGPPWDEHDFSAMKQSHIYSYPYQTLYYSCEIDYSEVCKFLDKQERTLYEKYENRWYKSVGQQWLDRNKNRVKDAGEWITTQYLNYDNYGNVGRIVSPDGNETIMEYDPAFNYAYPKSITQKNPAGMDLVTQYSYDPLTGQLSSITGPNNFTANYYYDGFSRLKSIKKPLDAEPSVNYDYLVSSTEKDWIKKTQAIDGTKNLDGFEYFDGLGRSTGTRTLNRGNDILTKTEYNQTGKIWKQFKAYKELDGENYFTETLYYDDPLNRVHKIIPPGSSNNIEMTFGINNGIRTTTLIDEKGHDKRSSFNEFNELVKLEECSNDTACNGNYTNINYYEYTHFGDLNAVIDAEGHKTEYYYDTLGRLVKEIHPDTGTTELKYDDESNLIQKITPKGIINYEYDALNRLTKIDYSSGTDVINVYDSCLNGKGKLCQVTDESGITGFEYDERGRIKKEVKNAERINYVTEYTYNLADRIETIKYPDPYGTTIKFYYNELNQIDHADNLTLSLQLASFSYNPNNSVKEINYGNNAKTSYDYYPRDWMKSIDIKDSGNNNLFQRSFEYDATGNLEKTYLSAVPGQGQLRASYTYDGLDRLSSATINSPVSKALSYSYDKAGNRKVMNDSGINYSYAYAYEILGNESQQLLEVKKVGVPSINLSYDAAGNLEGKNCSGAECVSAQYSYDFENRLKRIDFSDGNFNEFIYNYEGLRTEKIEGSDNSISFNVTYYFYDLAGNVLYERNIIYTAGDPNNDSKSSIADIVFLINYLFKMGNAPALTLAADPNGDCKASIGDIVYLINFLFKGGRAPSPGCYNQTLGQAKILFNSGNAEIGFGLGRANSLNKTVQVPITAKLDSNASAVKITLNYDASKLSVESAATTAKTKGMQLAFSNSTGKAVVGLISPDGSKSINFGTSEIIVLNVRPANFSSIDLSSIKIWEIEVVGEKAVELNASISSNTVTIPLKTIPKTGLVTAVD